VKKTSARRSGSSKAAAARDPVERYLARVPEPAHGALQKMRAIIRSVVPLETEELLSYGIPAFKYKKVLVWYAAFARHCSLFPTASVIAKFKDELKGCKLSKGTIQFPADKPLPAALLKKMVKARLAQVEEK
jgi:uncharacterized protein YdhG (YjbR/CyaY superfamily)